MNDNQPTSPAYGGETSTIPPSPHGGLKPEPQGSPLFAGYFVLDEAGVQCRGRRWPVGTPVAEVAPDEGVFRTWLHFGQVGIR